MNYLFVICAMLWMSVITVAGPCFSIGRLSSNIAVQTRVIQVAPCNLENQIEAGSRTIVDYVRETISSSDGALSPEGSRFIRCLQNAVDGKDAIIDSENQELELSRRDLPRYKVKPPQNRVNLLCQIENENVAMALLQRQADCMLCTTFHKDSSPEGAQTIEQKYKSFESLYQVIGETMQINSRVTHLYAQK